MSTPLVETLRKLQRAETKKEPLSTDFEVLLVADDVDTDGSKDALVVLKKSHFDLTSRANGKAELYFHCYFWTSYIDSVARACS